MKLLVTGAAGKVGQVFLPKFLASGAFRGWSLVALCNNRMIEGGARVDVLRGSIADESVIDRAMDGVTHVLHMAAVKESPGMAIDVSIKGMFVMLERFRRLETARQFVLVGGDCSVGHMFQDYPAPITEEAPRKAYPGCYALTKILEEVMLEQYQFQYGVNGCVLRAPWIMDKDDLKYALSFGLDQFGGPSWGELIGDEDLQTFRKGNHVPLMRDVTGAPLRRNFVHVDDLVAAILAALDNPKAHQALFNISMNEPVCYGRLAHYLAVSRGCAVADIPTPFHSNWLDNSKARHLLGWAPEVDLEALVDRAWDYRRDAKDPRTVWYPG
ncbi:NAD-dependent epimerase/dehydratase family protein [Roseibium sp.]|uniref:NAD-dependent epimerase/dehydratase family protein n=1 Tax=Roseibium sp. TaxID=1936156 RepID=UPI003A984950